jgi:hypothetical protein
MRSSPDSAHPPVEPAAAHPRQRDRIAMIGDQAHDPRSIESMQRLGDHPHTANRERDPPPRRAILERVIDSAPAAITVSLVIRSLSCEPRSGEADD